MNYLLKLCCNNLTSLLEQCLVQRLIIHPLVGQEVGHSSFQLSSNPVVLVEEEGVDGGESWLNDGPSVPSDKVVRTLGALRRESALSPRWKCWSGLVGLHLSINKASEVVRPLNCRTVDI